MSSVRIFAFASKGGALHDYPLPLEAPGATCSVRLRSLPGSSGVHIALANGKGTCLRAEVAAEGDEWVEVEVNWSREGAWSLLSPGRQILYLPLDSDYEPAPPLRPAYGSKQLDVALVIDGTTRVGPLGSAQSGTGAQATSPMLLDNPEHWERQADLLGQVVFGLAREMKADLRLAALAFGDRPVPSTSALDLRPLYNVYPEPPEDRSLRRDGIDRLRTRLLELPGTSGGDFVDSLADALSACRDLRWRRGARKLVILFGDSPGYSVLHPAPRGADGQVRELDVDVEAMALHRAGIEILSFYLAPEVDEVSRRALHPFLDHTRRQYQRIASHSKLFFEAPVQDSASLIRALRERLSAIGRGACPGTAPTVRRRGRSRES